MISLNGIQIDEADLKRQLEAQGFDVKKKNLCGLTVGDKIYVPLEVTGLDLDADCLNGYPIHVRYAGRGDWIRGGGIQYAHAELAIKDKLIREYEALYEQVQKNRFNQWGVPFLHDLCDKIAALKAQGEKR